jgi:cell division protein FtsI (penicillin-binding protein 3)
MKRQIKRNPRGRQRPPQAPRSPKKLIRSGRPIQSRQPSPGNQSRMKRKRSPRRSLIALSLDGLSLATSLLQQRFSRNPGHTDRQKIRRYRNRAGSSEKLGNPRIRLFMVWGILLVGMLGLMLKLYFLQVVEAADLRAKAEQQQSVNIHPFVPRRKILDRHGNVIALSRPAYTLSAHPTLFKESKVEIAEKLAPVIHRSPGELLDQFNQQESGIRVADDLTEPVANRIKDLFLDGLELTQTQRRFYPQQELFADVVGYVDLEGFGQAGIEYSQEKLLDRSMSRQVLTRSGEAWIADLLPDNFLKLDDVNIQLTLDSRLQRSAREALAKQVQETKARRGAVIVMDAYDGSLLSLVCEPTYDPNHYYDFDLELYKNWAIADLYEPGSTFKPIAVAIALQAGAIKPDNVFYDQGHIQVDGWPISNADYSYAGARGDITVPEIIKYSSNVGMVHIAEQMRPRAFYNWLERLGLGKTVTVDLPFETASYIRPDWEFIASPVHPATTAFGQGFSIAPIQLARLHAALANGGYLVTPHVVKGLYNSKGQAKWTLDLPEAKQVFSAKTTAKVVEMMEGVVQDEDGTGQLAQIPGFRIAGKTGTSQKVTAGSSGYSKYARITSFVGILPADNPRYVVLAVIDEPEGGFGGTVAAPVVREVMESLITIEGIAPSE